MEPLELVERYLDTWNETDANARGEALASVWADDAEYVDPLAAVSGRDEISDLIGTVQQQVPNHVFRLSAVSAVDVHHNVMRFWWELVPTSGGEPLAIGFDVAVTRNDGRIGRVVGFLDKAPAAA
jgi:ketosteroid isomerase-like protein